MVLQSDKQQKLREKKDVNIKRLKDGLALYNQENDTSYAIAETRVQGSMAMATVVQNDENDCDIDVAIVFDAIWWKVRNVGEIAERKNEIRGQIEKKWWNYKTEDTMFGGPHFVECYVIKNGECVAMQWIQVHIGEASI